MQNKFFGRKRVKSFMTRMLYTHTIVTTRTQREREREREILHLPRLNRKRVLHISYHLGGHDRSLVELGPFSSFLWRLSA